MDLKTKKTVTEMIAGIGVYIFALEIAALLVFGGLRPEIAAGLLVGGIAAALMAIHIASAVTLALDLDEGDSKKQMAVSYAKRWGLLAGLILLVYFTGLLNIAAVFLGLFGLKAGAYGQPLMHRLFKHMRG